MVIKLTQMGSCRQEKDDIKTAQTYVVSTCAFAKMVSRRRDACSLNGEL